MNLLKRKTCESSETRSTTMEVYFSGPSVDEHSMSVRDLAPALIGLADAIDRYKELSCPFADLDVRITATKAGSFDVILQILGTVVSLGQDAAGRAATAPTAAAPPPCASGGPGATRYRTR